MSEKPYTIDLLNETEAGALGLIASHWRQYYSVPETERLGSPDHDDRVIGHVLSELGITGSRAEYIAELAKLDAQLPAQSS